MSNIDQLRDELDKWSSVRYRIDNEGIEYCFRYYSSFMQIEDEEFHVKRRKLIDLMVDMEKYVTNKYIELADKIIELPEDK
jgi:hypothetical protein